MCLIQRLELDRHKGSAVYFLRQRLYLSCAEYLTRRWPEVQRLCLLFLVLSILHADGQRFGDFVLHACGLEVAD